MAAVRGLRVSVKAEASAGLALGLPSPEAESGLERGEPEPMEVEEGELEMVPVRRSLKELIPVREARGRSPGERVSRAWTGRKGRRPAARPGKVGGRREGSERPGGGGAWLERPGARGRTQGARKWVLRGCRRWES